MGTEKILLVADGIIVLLNDNGSRIDMKRQYDISFSIEEFGVLLKISGEVSDIPLPGTVLDHLINTDDTIIHLYVIGPFSLLGSYIGALPINRDDLLKAKGGWEYLNSNGGETSLNDIFV